MAREPDALWEDALERPDTDSLADEIIALALSWAGNDPERLREAERILDRTPTLGYHESDILYFDEDHVETPAEVCLTCSDPVAGRWVPVSFCPAPKKSGPCQTEKGGQP